MWSACNHRKRKSCQNDIKSWKLLEENSWNHKHFFKSWNWQIIVMPVTVWQGFECEVQAITGNGNDVKLAKTWIEEKKIVKSQLTSEIIFWHILDIWYQCAVRHHTLARVANQVELHWRGCSPLCCSCCCPSKASTLHSLQKTMRWVR